MYGNSVYSGYTYTCSVCLLLSPGTCRRRETRQLHLRNNTLLPVAWKLSGHDSMGDEFSFSSESGIVAPRTEFTLNVHFRAMKPNSYKRAVKLEVGGVKLPGNWRGGRSHVVRLEGWVESCGQTGGVGGVKGNGTYLRKCYD